MVDSSGRDATSDFHDVGHSQMAKNVMKKFAIGKVEGYVAPEPSAGGDGEGGFNVMMLIPV